MSGRTSSIVRLALAVAAIAALAGCSPEARARKILDRHEEEFIGCNEKLNQSMADMKASLKALAGGDRSGSRTSMDGSNASLAEGEECMREVKRKIREEREAASIPEDVFEGVWDAWVEDLEASGKLKREEF